jgi:predicted cupin superfamily sugar epimerase
MTSAASALVRTLQLAPHPEGGYFRELYRATEVVPTPRGPRPASTAIYFLLTNDTFSALHRIASDEAWHFYAGDALDIVTLDESRPGDDTRRDLRLDASAPFAVVPARTWFGARLAPGGAYALVGCTVAPGFDFADFELAEPSRLAARFPAHAAIVAELTRRP